MSEALVEGPAASIDEALIDVLIIGGGPIGLAAAIEARMAGLTATVIEPRIGPIDKACGEGIMPGAVAALARLGVDPAGRGIAGISYRGGGARADHGFRHSVGRGVRRTTLHAALALRAEQLGVEVVRGRAESFTQDAGSVTVLLVGGSAVQGRTVQGRIVRGRWMLGCDGLHSTVRELAGLAAPTRGPRRFGLRRHFAVAPWSDLVEVHWVVLSSDALPSSALANGALTSDARAGDAEPGSERAGGDRAHGEGARDEGARGEETHGERTRAGGARGRSAEVYVTPVSDFEVGVAVLGPPHTDYDAAVRAVPALAERLDGAAITTSTRGAGPLRQRTRARTAGRVLLVGDASGYVDAITGEGIRVGLAQARAAIECILAGKPRRYEREWRRVTRDFRMLTAGLVRLGASPLRPAIVPLARALPALYGAIVERLAR